MREREVQNSITLHAADKLIAAHDGDIALLYLYWLRSGTLDEEQAARALCRTLQEIRSAEEKLRRMGLLDSVPAQEATDEPPAESASARSLPKYSQRKIVELSNGNEELTAIYDEAAKVLGHPITVEDMRVFLGIYQHLGLRAEVILELMHFCEEHLNWDAKTHRTPSIRDIEKDAYAWAEKEILTLEQAEDYIHSQRQRNKDLLRLKELLDLPSLSRTQKKDLSAWLDQGFGEDAISIAADRTLTNLNTLKWSYLRQILQSWHEKGLHSAAEIEEKDPSRIRRADSSAKAEAKPLDDNTWAKIIDKI